MALAVVGADAASLGGLSASSLAGFNTTAGSGAPVVVTCDNFTGTTGATMSGRAAAVAASCGSAVWTVHLGTWTIQSNLGASSGTSNANATLNVGAANSTVQVDLTSLNTAGRVAGVVASHNGTSTYLAAVLTKGSPDQLELRLYQLGIPTVIATATPTIGATVTLRLTRNASSVTVAVNGTTLITSTLNALQLLGLGSGQRAGVFGGNANVRFDNFLVTTP